MKTGKGNWKPTINWAAIIALPADAVRYPGEAYGCFTVMHVPEQRGHVEHVLAETHGGLWRRRLARNRWAQPEQVEGRI